ncbi:MAG: efflux RND transporter permease subunit [Candidatus Omnitrophica bacterium]|nr:efflux RND transporter permease subunit [Candidatus Omnitrophota bacterium]MDE2009027.1 efflux RND transporter permease subunit [Candidatus Omnitrophota bacterium]MDE2230869.1 efflux RND transporter permease subunit [Candidatus Omnitrophota bacterium]
MIKKVIEFSANNKFLILIIIAAAIVGAIMAVRNIPLDAIPDLSDTQVIVYSRWNQSPDIMEDQVTYPIVTAMLGAPDVKAIRGFSDYGYSYVYIIFKDGTNLYWARSRTLEYLSKVLPALPKGVKTELGPDATSVGWVYQYALVDKSGKNDLSQLRSFQDWYLRYWLQSVPGVAEVASVGGFQKQYQVNVDPVALQAYNIPITKVIEAVRRSNNDVGARVVDFSGTEFMVRGRGYIKSTKDIENIVLRTDSHGRPVLVRDVATVTTGPQMRRGVTDLNGQGDTVGGIVIMRSGENALNVINRVKQKLKDIQPSLPPGVKIVTTYDRSDLIMRAIDTLKHQLIEEMIIVSLVIIFFLWHFPSASVPIATIPVAVLLSFIPMYAMKLTSNIMSLAGIAISIGVLVDGAIIMVENAYKKTQLWEASGRKENYHDVLLTALKEVGPSIFFSLLVIAVSFLPVFMLVGQSGRLFRPLAFSNNFTMVIAAVLSVTFVPAMFVLLVRVNEAHFRPKWLSKLYNFLRVGHYYPEEKHPVSKVLFNFYEPVCRFVLKYRVQTLIFAGMIFLSMIPVYLKLGSEFMPPLNEGTILYMPTTLPGISVTEAQKVLQETDKIIRTVPEVQSVFGKAGRADTSTDPAPLSMMETTIVLKPESQWRKVHRWYSSWMPGFLQGFFRPIWNDRITWQDIINELDEKVRLPGLSNAWTMPIKTRIDMLSTGIRTPVGIKILGPDLNEIERIGVKIENIVKHIKGARSVYAERVTGGYYLDYDFNSSALASYGLTIGDVEDVIASAIGGETVTTTVEGLERYSVNVRYLRQLRDDIPSLERILVSTPNGAQVPLGQLAKLKFVQGPGMVRNENGMPAGYVYVDMAGRDIGGFVRDAKQAVDKGLKLPSGYTLIWSGQYENMIRVAQRMKVIIPIALFIIFMLLYMNTRSHVKAGIVLLAVPFSLVGAVWFLYFLHYNLSVAVWVGMIALMGLDAETGVFMLLFLDLAYYQAIRLGKMKTNAQLQEAIVQGAVKRIRPKLMTVSAMFMGLVPIMWSIGAGSDVMKRIAAPMIGGIFSSFIMELLIYPVIYYLWKWNYEMKKGSVDVSKLPLPELKGH